MSQILHAKLSTVRRKRAFVASGTGLATALAAAVLILALCMVLDYWLDLPRGWRVALLVLNGLVVLAVLVGLIVLPILRRPDDEEVALAVEEHDRTFRTRLIAAVQFSRAGAVPAGASASMVRATIAQAEEMARPRDFTRVVNTDPLRNVTLIAAGVVVLCMCAYAYGGRASHDLLLRAFGSEIPVPRDTRVKLLGPSWLVVAQGDNVTLTAEAEGVIPPRGTLRVETGSGRTQSLPMDPTPGNHRVFAKTIENVQESFRYTARVNDGKAASTYQVEAVPRPAATKVTVEQVYPTYVGRPNEARALGDLSVLTGSQLKITALANKRVRATPLPDGTRNIVRLVGADRNVPLEVRSRRAKGPDGVEREVQELFAETDLPPGTTGFSIHLVDEYNLKSKDPAVYPIALLPDRAPRPRITEPKMRETLAVRQQKQWVRFDVTDDYGVAKVAIKFRVGEGDVQTIPLPASAVQAVRRGEYLWDLSTVDGFGAASATTQPSASPATTRSSSTPAQPLIEGDSIEFWLEAEDANDVSGPGRASSDHYTLRVVSEADWKAAMWTRLGDSIQTIKRTAEAQERLAGSTGTILLERPTGTSTTQPAATQPATAPVAP